MLEFKNEGTPRRLIGIGLLWLASMQRSSQYPSSPLQRFVEDGYTRDGRKLDSDRQEARLAAFLQIPLDEGIIDVYAELHAWATKGNPTPHNDLWIAATALSRRIPLVSCDRDFDRIAGEGFTLEHIYLPPRP